MSVRAREPADEERVAAFLRANHSERVARLEEVVRPLDHPALLAEGGRLAGVLTYVVADGECEILTLHAAAQWCGTGTALIEAVERARARAPSGRLSGARSVAQPYEIGSQQLRTEPLRLGRSPSAS